MTIDLLNAIPQFLNREQSSSVQHPMAVGTNACQVSEFGLPGAGNGPKRHVVMNLNETDSPRPETKCEIEPTHLALKLAGLLNHRLTLFGGQARRTLFRAVKSQDKAPLFGATVFLLRGGLRFCLLRTDCGAQRSCIEAECGSIKPVPSDYVVFQGRASLQAFSTTFNEVDIVAPEVHQLHVDPVRISEFGGSWNAIRLAQSVQKGRKSYQLWAVLTGRLRMVAKVELQRQHSFVPTPFNIARHRLPPGCMFNRSRALQAIGAAA